MWCLSKNVYLMISRMMKNILFIAGIHGVGKTTLAKKIADNFNKPHYSASSLIKRLKKDAFNKNKTVDNIERNQNILIDAINQFVPEDQIILDGHFGLLNANGIPEEIPIEVFKNMAPNCVVLMYGDVSEIVQRMETRDKVKYSNTILEELQAIEIRHAKFVIENLDIPIYYHKFDDDVQKLFEFLNVQW